MKEERRRARALQWFVRFVNLDLEPIEQADQDKLLADSDHLWPVKELREFGRPIPLAPQRLEDFSWALKIPDKKWCERQSGIIAAQKAIRGLFNSLQITARPSPEVRGAPSTAVAVVWRGHDEALWWVCKGPGVPYTFKWLPVAKSQEDYLRLKIFRLLDGFSQQAIRLCPACNKWFLNPSRREKRFCSDRCIWKTNSAKRRAARKKQKDGNRPTADQN